MMRKRGGSIYRKKIRSRKPSLLGKPKRKKKKLNMGNQKGKGRGRKERRGGKEREGIA